MCSICLHYCKYYHPWSLRRSQILSKCQHENHKPTVNEVEELTFVQLLGTKHHNTNVILFSVCQEQLLKMVMVYTLYRYIYI